jgi:formylglycine-generating enzyme required for sulfatase activity/acetyl esterase/lipase
MRIAAAVVLCCAAAVGAVAKEPWDIPLWTDGQVPGALGSGPLDKPFLTVFEPAAGKKTGAAMIVAPGGSNIMLMYGAEGIDIAERLNDWGITAFVLTYRMAPRYNDEARSADGRRAVQVVRAKARELGLDGARVGFAGFSAGSNLIRPMIGGSGPGKADAADPVERFSSRPDYAVVVYGPGRPVPGEDLKSFPPMFLLSAQFDRGPALGNANFFAELTRAGVPAEMHTYQRGRHGFGSGFGSPEFEGWMPQLKHFLDMNHMIVAKSGTGASGGPGEPKVVSSSVKPKVVDDGFGELVFVPAGAFRMGDSTGEGDPRERPVHTVDVSAFYIGRTEVTNAQWRRFRDDAGYDDAKIWPNGIVMPKDQIPYWTSKPNHGGGTPDSDNYPVQGVNWDAAVAYCKWLSGKTGKKYRLPTEAEWEKAARGTDQRRYPWGDGIDRTLANYVGAQQYDTGKAVGSYPKGASPYGALDMAGNVMEWCSDWYSKDSYAASAKKDPKGPAKGSYRVVRGGAFFFEPFDLRASARSAAWPSLQSHRMIGFRVARDQ